MSEKLLNEAHRRIDEVQKVVDRQIGEMAELARTIADQGRDLAAAKSAIATLQLRRAAKPEPARADGAGHVAIEPAVHVVQNMPPKVSRDLPDMTQCSSLLRLIGGRFPRFKSEPSNERWRDLDEQRELKAFRASLAFVRVGQEPRIWSLGRSEDDLLLIVDTGAGALGSFQDPTMASGRGDAVWGDRQ